MTTQTLPASRLGDLILVRLLSPANRLSINDARKSLALLFERRLSGSAWEQLFDEELSRLETDGLLSRKPLGLTDAGRTQAREFLGVDQLPARCDWKTLKNKFLVPKALGVPADTRAHLADAKGFRACLIKQHYDLPLGEKPTLARALNALLARDLGLDPSKKLTLRAIRTQFLQRTLHAPHLADHDQLAEQLAAQAVNALNPRIDSVREAVLANWLKTNDAEAADTVIILPPVQSTAPPATEPHAFAARVQAAACSCSTGRFGDNKVFIAHVWRQLQSEGAFPGLSEAEFKRQLAAANHAGLLHLSRADLVEAMNPDDVRESETTYLDAVFHFIQTER